MQYILFIIILLIIFGGISFIINIIKSILNFIKKIFKGLLWKR